MTPRASIAFLLVALTAGLGCEDSVPLDTGGDEPDYEVVLDLVAGPVTAIDVLLVVDDSASTFDQAALGDDLGPHFLDAADAAYGPLDWHVGVVSTDMGTGPHSDTGCSETGDDGQLQGGCLPNGERILIDVAGDGSRVRNFSGDRSDFLSCAVNLGVGGCGFEQPLASMRRALERSRSEDDGFLRDGAALAVLVFTDEEDCSAYDPAIFGDDSELGPRSSFRCFEFGVVCDGDDPRAPGVRSGCRPRDDSPYIEPVDSYVAFLDGLRPGQVAVVAVTGGESPVEVVLGGPDDDVPRLAASCISSSVSAAPSVRIAAWADSFPDRNVQHFICTEDYASVLSEAVELVGDLTHGPTRACLQGALADAADDPGVQPRCRAFSTPSVGDPQRSELAKCTAANATDCIAISASEACVVSGFEAAVVGDVVPDGSHLLVECESER